MPDIEYQKIELHSTYNLVKEQERIEYEKETVQRLMMEHQIQFAMEIERKEELPIISRKQNLVYVLNLIVRKDDVDKVIELLDKEGNFGYYVDLDATYDPTKDTEETESQEEQDEIIEELNEEVEEEPIKSYGEKVDYKSFPKLIMKIFLIVAFIIILIPEIVGIVYGIKETEYEIATAMFVFIVIETPIFIWFYNILNKKKGK